MATLPGYLFIVHANRLLPAEDGKPYWRLPAGAAPGQPPDILPIGNHRGHAVYAKALEQPDPQQRQALRSLRDWVEELPQPLFMLAGRALQLLHFYQTHRYCGGCGQPLSLNYSEQSAGCADCDLVFYPRLSPCVIVLVRKQDRLLLVQTHRHQGRLHSLVAGFVEPGETLEQAAMREVEEEAGIQIRDLRYIASQPWPFPHSLMAGFTAEWASGEIHIQTDEIAHADWFEVDDLPVLAPPGTIARTVIDMAIEAILGSTK